MLDGCTMSTAYGSSPMRPASTSALMSRSESNMRGQYRDEPLTAPCDLYPVITDGKDRPIAYPDHLTGPAPRRHPVGRGDRRSVGGSAVNDVDTTCIYPDGQVRLGNGPCLVGDLDQLRVFLTDLRLRVAPEQHESLDRDPPSVVQHYRPILDVGGTRSGIDLICKVGWRCCKFREILVPSRCAGRRTLRHRRHWARRLPRGIHVGARRLRG